MDEEKKHKFRNTLFAKLSGSRLADLLGGEDQNVRVGVNWGARLAATAAAALVVVVVVVVIRR